MSSKFFIGLVAPKGAGKGTFIRMLKELLTDYTVERVSSGDLLGQILDFMGEEKTRENLQKLPAALVEVLGEGIVSRLVAKNLGKSTADIAIFDGVRWDTDVLALRELGEGEHAHASIVYITAGTKLRYERSRKRGEKPEESSATWERFLEQEKALTEVSIKDIGERSADFQITNDGTEDEMRQQVGVFIQTVLGIQVFRRVILETPFAGNTPEETEENIRFARACMHDCLLRGEAPYASHLLYTQEGVLDDTVLHERELGMEAGFLWRGSADATVVYTDHGISPGMARGIQLAELAGNPVEYRQLNTP